MELLDSLIKIILIELIELYNKIKYTNRMQQLELIFEQRNKDITVLKQHNNKDKKKQEFQERQKIRVQRENWILKIIKTIKIFTTQNKRNIYSSVAKMMSYFQPEISVNWDIDYDNNFTEELINLFFKFYSQCGGGDTTPVKKIIRPNNAFIIIDLVKQLVETHRQFFKVKLMQSFKQPLKLEERPKAKVQLILSRRELHTTEPSQLEEPKKDPVVVETSRVYDKIQQAILEKWQSFVNFFPDEKILSSRMNDSYIELLERNSQNNFMINKFQEKCFGKSRTFSYNYAGLYTNEEIQTMENKLKTDVKQKFFSTKELFGNPSAEQLRQFFKIKIQMQEGIDKFDSRKFNTKPINSWFPLVVQKSGLQNSPLNVYVIFAKDQILLNEFSEKCGISLKNYLRVILKNKLDQIREIKELKNFKRHHFLDLNHAKKRQLMMDQHRVYEKSKKQLIFPILRHNELRQQTEIAIKNRSMSDYKLAPIFKNDILSRKLDIFEKDIEKNSPNLHMLSHKQIPSTQRKQQKQKSRKTKQNGKSTKSNIQSIIQMIIKDKNPTLTI